MKIAVVGSGAMGSLTGGLLREAGADVHLYSVNREHIKNIKLNGLVIEGIGGQRTIKVNATINIEEIGIADLIIMFVKSYDTGAAADFARKIAGANTFVLTLQNGIGNIEVLGRFFDTDRILAGTTDAAATIVSPGRVKHTSGGNIYIGNLTGEITFRIKELVNLLQKSGFNAHPTDNTIGMIWTKFIMNLAINPLGTILRVTCRGLIDNEHARVLMKNIVDEALQVAEKKGIQLLSADMVQAAYDLAEKNADSQNSMLQDFLKGKRTEIDFISGAIVREGEQIGIDTPVNRTMTYLIKALTLRG
ncbi:MAG: 2-dehydropantoate 2-reductase [Proteobacteria bacterium]|nr:2-dehydropantoate 2-reductase [Pseudomonadota bacterium]MBU1712866.1 2-dehydropantoate 2-reductase [Pseudomonadota bacterium]